MRLVVFVALLLLAACQPLPHPFADDMPPPNSPILTPPDSVGILVEPVAGAPEPAAHDLAAAMALALQKEDVPASTQARNRGSYRLSGKASASDTGGKTLQIVVLWQMMAPDGRTLSSQESRQLLAEADWQQGGKAVTELARQSAPTLAKVVQTTAPSPLLGSDPLIAVQPVTGAPGDGSRSLARAMADALKRANLALAEKPEDKPTFLVQGKVDLGPAAGGKQPIKISWTLRRVDGGQVGEVKQENAIAAGSLDGAWGLTAYDVANAAAPGIAALIAELQKSGKS